MAQVDSCWPVTAEDRVRSEGNPCGTCGGRSALVTGFSFFALSVPFPSFVTLDHPFITYAIQTLQLTASSNSTLQKEDNDLVIQGVTHLFRSVFTHLVITGALCNGPVF